MVIVLTAVFRIIEILISALTAFFKDEEIIFLTNNDLLEAQKILDSQTLSKMSNAGVNSIPDFKLHYRARVIINSMSHSQK